MKVKSPAVNFDWKKFLAQRPLCSHFKASNNEKTSIFGTLNQIYPSFAVFTKIYKQLVRIEKIFLYGCQLRFNEKVYQGGKRG